MTEKHWNAGDVYPLKYPFELSNAKGEVLQPVNSVTLRRLNGADLAAVANASARGPGDALKEVVCRVAGVPPSTFDRMDAVDLTELGVISAGFIGGALPTGGT